MKRVPNFDWLRLFLALEVVYAHANAIGNHAARTQVLIDPVPAFVALSGYLIPASLFSSIDRHGNSGWKHFTWKRIVRVQPAFVASLVLAAVLFGFSGVTTSLACYATIGLMVIPGCANGALWSLALEEILYASLVVTQAKKLFTPKIVAGCAALCFVLAVALSGNNEVDRIFRASAGYFLGNVAYFNRAKLGTVWSVPAFALVAGASWYATGPLSSVLSPFVGILAVLSALALPQLVECPLDISYSLYVLHVPILCYLVYVVKAASPVPMTLGVAVGAAMLCAVAVEKPALKLKNRLPSWPKPRREARVFEAAA